MTAIKNRGTHINRSLCVPCFVVQPFSAPIPCSPSNWSTHIHPGRCSARAKQTLAARMPKNFAVAERGSFRFQIARPVWVDGVFQARSAVHEGLNGNATVFPRMSKHNVESFPQNRSPIRFPLPQMVLDDWPIARFRGLEWKLIIMLDKPSSRDAQPQIPG